MSTDPRRLLDDAQTSDVVRRDLSLARGASPPEYDVGKGLERLLAATAPVAAAGASVWALSRVLRFVVQSKWWLGGMVGLAAAGGATYEVIEHRHAAAPTAMTAPSAVVTTPAATTATGPAVSTEPAPPEAPSAEVATVVGSAVVVPSGAPRGRGRSKGPADERVAQEVRLLGRARDALSSNPAEALALTQEGQREFPQGVLSEEREAIAILALSRLGRAREAETRGRAFLGRFPDGPFSERVRRAIGAGPAR